MSIIWDIIKAIPMIINAIKSLIAAWKEAKYNSNKKDFEQGTEERDQTKIEESFDSGKAGKPSGLGTIVDD